MPPTEAGQRRNPGLGLSLAPTAALFVWWLLPRASFDNAGVLVAGLSDEGRIVAAVGVAMAVLWLTEALPVAATALFPIALLPLLTRGELAIREVAAPYAHELIFLYMGGFMLALAMQRWGLHRRISLHIIQLLGDRPDRLVLGFMLSSALLSMWISNTATVVMMLPIALSVVELVRQRLAQGEGNGGAGEEETGDGETEGSVDDRKEPFPFAVALLLGTAYAASIGGVATLIGTPPNLLLAAFVEDNYGQDLSFGSWLPLGLTITVILLPICWWLLVKVLYRTEIERVPGGREMIRTELERQGPMTRAEGIVLAVFSVTALLWVTRGWLVKIESAEGVRPLAGLTDPGIALIAALILFAWPLDLRKRVFILGWQQARQLPWGILLLFGGGLSLAAAVRQTGVDTYIGRSIARLEGIPVWMLVLVVTTIVILLTEMTSNTATTATFLPIMAATAQGLGVEPMRLLIPMTLAASCAFMMPVATPPNAIVFGSGEITIPQMCRAGIWLNLISVLVIFGLTSLWL